MGRLPANGAAAAPARAPAPLPALSAGEPGRGAIPERAVRLSRSIRRLQRAVGALLVLGICGFLIDGANRPANPSLVPAYDPTAVRGSPPMGTATLSVITRTTGPACVLEAVTPRQQSFGLMGRTSVAPYAGMAFVFASPSVERFWMKETVIPLSIAWFDDQGRFLSETLMPPCPKLVSNCPTYGPTKPYSLAVEVPAGRLGSLGIGPGSVVQVGGPCS